MFSTFRSDKNCFRSQQIPTSSCVLWFTREQLSLLQSTSPARTSANLAGSCVKGTARMRAAPNAAAYRLGLTNKDFTQTVQMGIRMQIHVNR